MPDLAAISASCSSMMLSAGASPSRPPSADCGTLRFERCVPSSYTTSKRTNSPTIRVPGLRAMLLFLVRGRPTRCGAVCPNSQESATVADGCSQISNDETESRRQSGLQFTFAASATVTGSSPHIRKCLLQILDLRRVVESNVGLVGVPDRVVLVIGLGREECRVHGAGLGHDRAPESLRRIELRDVILCDFRLCIALRENLRAILRSGVRALAVELRRVVRDREEDLQDLAVGHLLRIESHLHGFGVAGAARADGLVNGILLRATGIARHRVLHALHVLVHGLDAPEAAAREHCGL